MTKTFIALTSAVLLLAACSKSSNKGSGGSGGGPGGASGSTNLIKSITSILQTPSGTDTAVSSFTYDSQNRPIQSISGTDTARYTYGSNTLTSVGEATMTVYFLNASGTADSAYQAYDLPGFGAGVTSPLSNGSYIFRYTYGSDGYLTRQYTYRVTSVGDTLFEAYLFTTTGGNITMVTDSIHQTSTPLTYTTQTTTTSALPPDPLVGPYLDFGATTIGNLLGKPDVNLIAAIPELIGSQTNTIKLTYTLDAQGRIAKVIEDTPAGLLAPDVAYYTYY